VFVTSTSPPVLSLRVSGQECLVARYAQTSMVVGCSWQVLLPRCLSTSRWSGVSCGKMFPTPMVWSLGNADLPARPS
jgi:hypothetical protein